LLVLLVPGLLAFVFGFFAFRSRIKGVYFSIITQAMTFAAMLLFFRNETGFGGNNGFTDFKRILGIPIAALHPHGAVRADRPDAARLLPDGPLDREQQVRPRAAGHPRCREPRHVHRLQPAGLQAGHLDPVGRDVRRGRGALRAAGGHHQPQRDEPGGLHRDRHLGGRGRTGTLIGPIVGAFFVNGAKSWFTQVFPEFWLYFLGALFIAVTLFLPNGIVGLAAKLNGRKKEERA
jgi:urea transport system permease protein